MPPKRPRSRTTPAARDEPATRDVHSVVSHVPLLFGLVNAGFGRMNYALATMLIGFGGLALAVAWNAGPHKALDSRRFAKLTARAPAHVAERWLAVEFDPADVGTAATWYAAARASPCVVVQYTTEWSAIARRAFCGRRLPLADSLSPHRVTELTPGVPFSWQRDERGFIVPELRMSAAAKQWLSAHKPSSSSAAVAGDPHALDELSALRLSMEQPVEGAIAGWGTEEGDFVLALDPSQPGQAWPAGFVVDEARRRPQWPMAAIGALIGLLFWFNGMQIFTAGAPRSRAWFVTIVPLLALPWWGDGFGRALRPLNASFAPVIGGMMATVGELERLVASAPDEAALVDGERLSWRVDGGAYADTFKAFTFRLPQPRPADPNAALLAFNDAIATQMRAFEAKTQARVFDRLAQDKRDGQSRAGFAFLRAAQQALVDPSRPPAVQDAARGFLKSCVTQPVDDPFPGEIAFESRLALLRELATIPPPNDIAAPAGWIVSRAEERRDAPPLRPGGD